MGIFTYPVGDELTATITVPDALDDFYRVQPGYSQVIDAEHAEELKGQALADEAKAHGIPSSLHADETRAALVDATAPPELDPETSAPAGRGRKTTTTSEEL